MRRMSDRRRQWEVTATAVGTDLNAPALMKHVWLGAQHVDGLTIHAAEEVAA